jgi:ADP-ribose pyrophosphatase YjhB (NUDIX family)
VIDDGEILLVERGAGAAVGHWAVPGGRVEPGETLAGAVVREVAEETALTVASGELIGLNEVVGETHHYVVACFHATVNDRREPVAGSDAAAAAWIPVDTIESLSLVPGLLDFLRQHGVLTD